MKIKKTIGVFLLMSLILLSACQPYKEPITLLLQQDANTAKESGGDKTKQAAAMRDLDLSKCPSDFAAAYVDHIHAWEQAAEIQRAQQALKSDDNVKGTLVASLLSSLFKTDDTPIADAIEANKKLDALEVDAHAQIKETFNKVEHIAASYGAELPH